jgi:hypothetical protein
MSLSSRTFRCFYLHTISSHQKPIFCEIAFADGLIDALTVAHRTSEFVSSITRLSGIDPASSSLCHLFSITPCLQHTPRYRIPISLHLHVGIQFKSLNPRNQTFGFNAYQAYHGLLSQFGVSKSVRLALGHHVVIRRMVYAILTILGARKGLFGCLKGVGEVLEFVIALLSSGGYLFSWVLKFVRVAFC